MSDSESTSTNEPTVSPAAQHGSLERGVAGDYMLNVGAILSEAWARTNGAKGTFSIALLIYGAVVIGVMTALVIFSVVGAFFGALLPGTWLINSWEAIAQLVYIAVVTPMNAGLFIMGLRRSVNAPISGDMVLRYFHLILPLLGLALLMYVMLAIGYVLLIIPGIYLSVAYCLALPLLVDKNLGIWQALETSRKAVSKRWFAVFGLLLILTIANAATALTLFIGMIWTIPWSVIAIGILYRNMFGVEAGTAA